jgi:acyl-CoA dehydrogenase
MADQSFLDWPFFGPQHKALRQSLDSWAQDRVAALSDHHDVDGSCRKLVAALGRDGWLKPVAPAACGGQGSGYDVRSLCLSRETLAYHDGLADFAFAMQGLGSGPITLFGTDEQKRRFLPDVVAGKSLAAFALSETEAGSDVAALACAATPDGPDHVRLNGEKMWISNGGIADFYVVFARTGEAPGARGLSAFVVPADTGGLEIAERIDVIAPHPLARLRFHDCRIPRANQIGKGGEGFKIAMATLDVFRSTVGAAALGFARRALDEAMERVSTRHLFGQPMAALPLAQASLAEMATDVDAAALLVYRAAWAKDNGAERITREAAMAKMVATEHAQVVIDKAVQLFGGLGVRSCMRVEMLYRYVRALRIYEGATEVQKFIIAREILRQHGPQA